MRKVKVPFIQSECDIPIIEFELSNGNKGLAIIDTGSDTSLVDKDFVIANKKEFKIKKRKQSASFSGLSASSDMPIVEAGVKVKFAGMEYPFLANVFPMTFVMAMKEVYDVSPVVLIGSDMLIALSADINYLKKEVTFAYDDLSCEQ